MKAKYNVFQVAKWFLNKEPMTHKRLQKMCYYAEAWYFTLKKQSLTETKFEAWDHGPVSVELFNVFKYRGLEEINAKELSSQLDINEVDDNDFLELVWNTYGKFGANALEVITHSEEPWKLSRSEYKDNGKCNSEITRERMRDYYKTIYKGSEDESIN